MTKAKRYEGERLRAEQWHNMGRDKAWEAKRAGLRELEAIVKGKFELYCEAKYDPVDCGYLVVLEVSQRRPQHVPGVRVLHSYDVVLTHEEPCLEFPSDHLKTKLLLLVG